MKSNIFSKKPNNFWTHCIKNSKSTKIVCGSLNNFLYYIFIFLFVHQIPYSFALNPQENHKKLTFFFCSKTYIHQCKFFSLIPAIISRLAPENLRNCSKIVELSKKLTSCLRNQLREANSAQVSGSNVEF